MPYMLSLYTTFNEFSDADEIAAHFPKARYSVQRSTPKSWSKMTLTWPKYSITLNYRGIEDPEMPAHLNGFAGFAWQAAGEQMDQQTYRLIQKIQNVKHNIGIVVEPDIDDADEAQRLIFGLAEQHHAMLFIGGAVTDWKLHQLSGPAKSRHAEASYGETRDAVARRDRSNVALKKLGVGIAKSLPPLLGEDETRLRSPLEVLDRTGAIAICAARAEPDGLTKEEARNAAQRFGVAHALSPDEQSFLDQDEVDQPNRLKFSWRYECIAVLLWSLNQLKELPFPKAICDVPALSKCVRELCTKRPALKLRSTAEILDAADFNYRLHWATVDHRTNGKKTPTGGAHEGIIRERHYAFNWLIGLRHEAWDAVQTDT